MSSESKKVTESNADMFLTIRQVAERLQLSRPTIYELFKKGRLTPIKFGSATRIRSTELQNLK